MRFLSLNSITIRKALQVFVVKSGWDKSPSLSIIFGLSSKTQWLSGLYYADFISFYSPTQLCGGGTTKSNSNELPISVPLSFCFGQTQFYLASYHVLPSFSSASSGTASSIADSMVSLTSSLIAVSSSLGTCRTISSCT